MTALKTNIDETSAEGAVLPDDVEESDSLSADLISVTETGTVRSKGVFSSMQVNALVELFQDMVSAGKPISKPVIIERLSKNNSLGEYNVEQVDNRLKYERRQKRKLK